LTFEETQTPAATPATRPIASNLRSGMDLDVFAANGDFDKGAPFNPNRTAAFSSREEGVRFLGHSTFVRFRASRTSGRFSLAKAQEPWSPCSSFAPCRPYPFAVRSRPGRTSNCPCHRRRARTFHGQKSRTSHPESSTGRSSRSHPRKVPLGETR